MNREIKFRGLVLQSCRFWCYGSLRICDDGMHIIYDKYSRDNFAVDYKTIGQFTGLCDRKGKEIYEGDIFQRYNSIVDKVEFLEICYAENLCAFWVKGFGNLNRDVSKHFEVIGNIYENPELMK